MNTASERHHEIVECPKCLMSSGVDTRFSLGETGACLGCESFESRKTARWKPFGESDGSLQKVVDSIRKRAKNSNWDCVLGMSGGVDSSYLALKLKDLGLRVYAVHVDNGWNSRTAVSNIHAILDYCGFQLDTAILHAPTFHDLQKSFLLASVPDLEIPTDHAIQAILWNTAREQGIPTIISGMNFATESGEFEHWAYGHSDWRYIHGIWKKFGTPNIKRYPHFSYLDLLKSSLSGIRIASLLNYLDFHKQQAVEHLEEKTNWKPYGGKHYESIYTRWVQGFVLPKKFGIDKRYAHLSDVIRSEQVTKQEARLALESDTYPAELLYQDELLVLKKFGQNHSFLGNYLSESPKSFRDYKNNRLTYSALKGLVDLLRGLKLYPR